MLALSPNDPTTRTYGRAKNEIAFDKDNISGAEVDKLAAAFKATTFFDDTDTKYTYAEKSGKSYEISISCNGSVVANPEVTEVFAQLRADVQTMFPGHKIILKLVVDDLDNVVKRIE